MQDFGSRQGCASKRTPLKPLFSARNRRIPQRKVAISSRQAHSQCHSRPAAACLLPFVSGDFMKNAISGLLVGFEGSYLLMVALLLGTSFHAGASGNVVGWGNDAASQIRIPTNIGLSAISVAAGGSHSLALKTDGTVSGWGFNVFRQRDVPAGLSNVVAIAAGEGHSLALRSNGTVVTWGNHPPAPTGLTNVVEIAAGRNHSLARLADGTLVSWGSLTNIPPHIVNPVGIAAGDGYSLAVQADGHVIAWGQEKPVTIQLPDSLTNIVAVAAGYDHALALQQDGRVVAWGTNGSGQCNVPEGLAGVVAITAGAEHSLCLKWDSTLTAWGASNFNQVPALALVNCTSISAGAHHNLAVRGSGAPILWVEPRDMEVLFNRPGSMHVLASGATPLQYQWQRNGTNITGATTSTLRFPSAQPQDEGWYRVIVTNRFGRVLSREALFHPIGEIPRIVMEPTNTVALCGESARFSVSAEGSTPLNYQWYYEGTPLASATKTRMELTDVHWTNGGFYWVVVSNFQGAVTSTWASLSVEAVQPTISSPLRAGATQGRIFTYVIRGNHDPISFGAANLPPGLTFNPTNGVISGTPEESGVFGAVIGATNLCASDYKTLIITITSAIPQITLTGIISGQEGTPLAYTVRTTEPVDGFVAKGLPPGLRMNYTSGLISGVPAYAGQWQSQVTVSNQWGMSEGTLVIVIGNAPVGGLSIDRVTPIYSSPYVLDFEFTLRGNNEPALGKSLVVEPRLLSATCLEDGIPISAYETGSFIAQGSSRLSKTFLILDYTLSVASLRHGDSDNDDLSDAVEAMVTNATLFVERQHTGSQVGVYEFHREDEDPHKVSELTTDRATTIQDIEGIWTNYVRGFPGGSRAWDAVMKAVDDLGPANPDESHSILLVSDGRDESSTNTFQQLSNRVMEAKITLYVLGLGEMSASQDLEELCANTGGRFYASADVNSFVEAFSSIQADFLGRYILRWATLKRGAIEFDPSFRIHYGSLTAESPPANSVEDKVDTSTEPPTTNSITNWNIRPFAVSNYAGAVSEGRLRLAADSDSPSTPVVLRSTYIPRHVQQLRIHYRPNWPCQVERMSAGPGEMLANWRISQTNDDTGGYWLTLDTPSTVNALPFGAFGNLLRFTFRDIINSSNAFAFFEIDNSVYSSASKISIAIDSASVQRFTTTYAALPHGTPVPWLARHGIQGDLIQAELADPDGDGIPTWQEYPAGTDPADANSAFRVNLVALLDTGRTEISFTSAQGRTYQVDSSEDLVTWRRIWEKVPGTGQPITFKDNRYEENLRQRYYRVRVY